MKPHPLTRFGATPTGPQAEVFRRQAAHFTLLGSPLYGRLAGQLAEDPRPVCAILEDDASWDLELRVWPEPARLVALADYHGNWVDCLET